VGKGRENLNGPVLSLKIEFGIDFRENGLASGSAGSEIYVLPQCSGGTNILTRLILVSAALFLLLAASAHTQKIEIVCHFGYGGKNQLDTRTGTFTHDMVRGPDTTIILTLTQVEKLRILSYADSNGFFDFPPKLYAIPESGDSTPEPGESDIKPMFTIVSPCGHNSLLISVGDRQNQVNWDNCTEPQDPRHEPLDELVRMIREMVKAKQAYKTLPIPRGAYR
jgi:hypothetical protein